MHMFKSVRGWVAKRVKALSLWVIGGTISLLVLSCYFCPSAFVWIESTRAEALAPPQYPSSQLVEEELQSGGNARNESYLRVYKTSDDVRDVLTYMEGHLPGFTETDSPSAGGPAYHNLVFDSRIEQLLGDPGPSSMDWPYDTYPHVSVLIHPDPDDPTGTIIKVWTGWPVP